MGHAKMVGGNLNMGVHPAGIPASELAIGSIVKLMEKGVPTDYLVVNQGIPSNSSLYDSSCDGTWLLRKDIYETRRVTIAKTNIYETSELHQYLNELFLETVYLENSYDRLTRDAIKQVKIPYRKNGGSNGTNQSGVNGLSAKVFLLSGYELGWTTSTSSNFPVDGACLDYFVGCAKKDAKRIAYLNNTATYWWTRSPATNNTTSFFQVFSTGDGGSSYYGSSIAGIRPALILPKTALFDEKTMLFKGVL